MTTKKKTNSKPKKQLTPEEVKQVSEIVSPFAVAEVNDAKLPSGKGYVVSQNGNIEAFFVDNKKAWAYAADRASMQMSEHRVELWLLEGDAYRIEREQEEIDEKIRVVTDKYTKEVLTEK